MITRLSCDSFEDAAKFVEFIDTNYSHLSHKVQANEDELFPMVITTIEPTKANELYLKYKNQ